MVLAGFSSLEPWFRPLGAGFAAAALLIAALAPPSASAAPPAEPTDSHAFRPVADAYVDAAWPATSFGAGSGLKVDAKSAKQSFLRFDLTGIAGRTVKNVRLRMYQTDAAPSGGRVFSTSSTTWTEAITWRNRPAIDGGLLGTFGAVAKKTAYEADLGPFVGSDGPVSLALDSTNSDGAVWSSRGAANPPLLIVDLEPVDGLVIDGLSEVASPNSGSSDPTYFPSNHRMAITSSGRLLALHGLHAQGVQLAWRNPGGGWQRDTRGAVSDGRLLSGAGTGDRAASIAVGTGSDGAEHAWVVWGATSFSRAHDLRMRRLSDLDAPGGPTVGPVVVVDSPTLGAARPDIALEEQPDGSFRGVITWTRRTGASSYELVTKWFTNLDSDAPSWHDENVLLTASTSQRTGTLEPAPDGVRLVARGSAGKLKLYGHDRSDPPTQWWAGPAGLVTSTRSYPSATVLDSGDALVATESDANGNVVTVQRFSANSVVTELTITGYSAPAIASDGTGAWLVMIRTADGAVVSRHLAPGAGWDPESEERVEIGPEGGGNYDYPNVIRRTDGRLRILVRGPRGGTGSGSQNAVLAYQRTL